jgi:phosphomannomutase
MNAIFIKYILSKKKGKIVATYDCASELEDLTKKYGGELIWCRVGHGFIEQKVVENNALFACEQSSHFYFNEFYPFSDGIMATVYLAKILQETGKNLLQLMKEVKLHPVEKTYIDAVNDEIKFKVMEELEKEYPNAQKLEDGIKIRINKVEWVLLRTSQTLPEINICAEGRDKKRLKQIVEKYSKIVNEKIGKFHG